MISLMSDIEYLENGEKTPQLIRYLCNDFCFIGSIWLLFVSIFILRGQVQVIMKSTWNLSALFERQLMVNGCD